MELFKNFFDHPKTTIEGTVWGVAVTGVVYYALNTMHCDLTLVTGANFLPFLAGAIPVIRGAFAQDRTGGPNGTVIAPPAP